MTFYDYRCRISSTVSPSNLRCPRLKQIQLLNPNARRNLCVASQRDRGESAGCPVHHSVTNLVRTSCRGTGRTTLNRLLTSDFYGYKWGEHSMNAVPRCSKWFMGVIAVGLMLVFACTDDLVLEDIELTVDPHLDSIRWGQSPGAVIVAMNLSEATWEKDEWPTLPHGSIIPFMHMKNPETMAWYGMKPHVWDHTMGLFDIEEMISWFTIIYLHFSKTDHSKIDWYQCIPPMVSNHK